MCPDAVACNQILEMRTAWFYRVLVSFLFLGIIQLDNTIFNMILFLFHLVIV